MSNPLVSVILPIYNGEKYLKESINSILEQKYQEIELILIDDGSTDSSQSVVESFDDSRIRYSYQKNKGLSETLNHGIEISLGKFIARQDQDDISCKDRLSHQVNFMENYEDYALLGTGANIIARDKKTDRVLSHPTKNSELQFNLLFLNPFVHSSVLIRKKHLVSVGGYSTDPLRQPPEDYELWSRLARKYKVANLPEKLIVYREISGSMSRFLGREIFDGTTMISVENIAKCALKSYSNNVLKDFSLFQNRSFRYLSMRPNLDEFKIILDSILVFLSKRLSAKETSNIKKFAQFQFKSNVKAFNSFPWELFLRAKELVSHV